MKMPLPLLCGPTDEGVARGALPGRRSKDHTCQKAARLVGDGVEKILANSAAPTQIMKLRQSRGALLSRRNLGAHFADRQAPHAAKSSRDRSLIPSGRHRPLAAPPPIRWRPAPTHPLDIAALLAHSPATA